MIRRTGVGSGRALLLAGMLLAMLAARGQAQEGHPLTGSWSGDRSVDGQRSRVLLVMDLGRDQVISGYVLENGKRSALENVTLDLESWTVAFSLADGYQVNGTIGELGSQTERTITGTWTDGSKRGVFHVDIN